MKSVAVMDQSLLDAGYLRLDAIQQAFAASLGHSEQHDVQFFSTLLTAYLKLNKIPDDAEAAAKLDWNNHVIVMRKSLVHERDVMLIGEQQ
jgi:hypothetical protein